VTLGEALGRLAALLEEERLAIRAIDSERVLALVEEKQLVLGVLERASWSDDRAAIERFRSLVPQLRENGVLLAHARNSARDLVQALTQASPSTYGASGALANDRTGTRISVDV